MDLHISIEYVLALAAGILILVAPKLMKYIVAAYLIAYGVLGMVR